jgi:type I restriction enzyme, S subunit
MSTVDSAARTLPIDLPNEWAVSSVGQLFDVKQGKALSPKVRSGTSPRKFLRTANVLWGRLDLGKVDEMEFTDEEARQLALEEGDLLVCEGGDVGRTAIWRGELPGCLYQNHVHRLRKRIEDIDPAFVMHWLRAAFGSLNLFEGVANRTTIPNLSAARLKSLTVPRPDLAEQQLIAEVLSNVQCAMELEEKRLAALRELKAATMAKVFREGLRGGAKKPTEVGEIPGSWNVARLGSVCRFSSGGTPARDNPRYWGGTIPWVKTGEISYREITATTEAITEAGLRASAAKVLPKGTLLMAMYGQGVTRGRVAVLGIDAATNQACVALIPDERVLLIGFLYAYLEYAYDRVRDLGHGANQKNLSAEILNRLQVPIPSDLGEQESIATLSGVIGDRIDAAEQRLGTVGNLFQCLLDKLMRGELRVTALLEQAAANAG